MHENNVDTSGKQYFSRVFKIQRATAVAKSGVSSSESFPALLTLHNIPKGVVQALSDNGINEDNIMLSEMELSTYDFR